ncbi:uncharacterized protein [Drosophila kikkawai]|uniref:Transmembrane protein n=1 Tax=Drosophila kikkawai TaxID=30033 RepID=A0ABM3C6C8_DROKI|nr:uncharacterized protein LOC108072531 [Drosophila kikkawai]XP_041631851.1 uncharacterized protein LOC108072531 [Drosophila kikkawai]KAH8308055.1 hypothetical protein KR059_005502 [Drosophila kikkawai]
MIHTLLRRHLLSSRRAIVKTQGAPVRSYMPLAGPPRFPMNPAQRLILGVGPLILMMVIPYWALFNMPRWSRMHLGLPPEEEEEEAEPPPENAK